MVICGPRFLNAGQAANQSPATAPAVEYDSKGRADRAIAFPLSLDHKKRRGQVVRPGGSKAWRENTSRHAVQRVKRRSAAIAERRNIPRDLDARRPGG
jgi:Tfp pilus assembly protein FimV